MLKNNYLLKAFLAIFFGLFINCSAYAKPNQLPKDFVHVQQIIPNIQINLRYYGAYNFVGERISGYKKPKCILTKQAADALKQAQKELNRYGLSLKIYDAYRPQKAVDEFVRWGKDLTDTKMKKYFYPNVDKKNLFKDGYIAAKSSHSRGSTVDLTIICLNHCYGKKYKTLDMGSPFDFFSKISWPSYRKITASERAHRLLLRLVMEKHGFKPLKTEWWHFTLKNEPFPNTYYNFDIQ